MPFGMINSAATLKRAMKKLIEDLDDVDFYWDDILVHTRTWEEHIRALRELFSRLVQAGLTIRPTKCLFGVNSVDFLGHRLEQGMTVLHQDNVEKIKDTPRPSTKKQVRSFMGLAGYYRDFIPNFAAVCYASKKQSSAERNYSTIEKECLAIVLGIKKSHVYVYGVPFVLQTDHEPLKYMDGEKYTNARLMRWAMDLQSYNFKVEAFKGSENVGAGYLSRVEE